MSKDLEARVARLERAIGGTGVNIHQFDDAAQQAAHQKQLDDNAKAAEAAAPKEEA